MIPIRINLLSPQKRRFHRQAVYFQFIKNGLEVCLLVVCACTSAIVIGSATLENTAQQMSARQTIADSRYAKYSQQIERVNKRLETIVSVTDAVVPWHTLLPELSAAIPPAVSIDTINIDASERSLTLSGTAATRDDLLALVASLGKVPWIKDSITLPSSALTQREEIRFSLPVSLK